MKKYSNELEQFIYQFCYEKIFREIFSYVADHPMKLDLKYSRVKNPETAYVQDMILQFTRNIRIEEDTLSFEAVVSCEIFLEDDQNRNAEINQWLIVSCVAVIQECFKSLEIISISNYHHNACKVSSGNVASANVVPVLYKKDLESEAEKFLKKYYPEALEKPMKVPIRDIAEAMGLEIVQEYRITQDFSVLGEICFSSGDVKLYDPIRCKYFDYHVKRGTILIDENTFWERNAGCVNNTVAHEVFHWYMHRLYAAVKQIIRKESVIAHRCPSELVYPAENEQWSDEQRMEWQANCMAPRILMPMKAFRMKVEELYKKYNYSSASEDTDILLRVVNDLAKFYGVSKQSALIRMIESGYKEAEGVSLYTKRKDDHFKISVHELFHEYFNNSELYKLINQNVFRYVDCYVVINDIKYICTTENGTYKLTEYALENLDECALKFSWQAVRQNFLTKNVSNQIFL